MRGGAGRPEGHVDAARLDHRRGRGVGVEGVRELRRRRRGTASGRGRSCRVSWSTPRRTARWPSGVAVVSQIWLPEHDRRRPGAAVDRRLPAHVLRLAPRDRHGGALRDAGSIRSAELGPLPAGTEQHGDDRDGRARATSSCPLQHLVSLRLLRSRIRDVKLPSRWAEILMIVRGRLVEIRDHRLGLIDACRHRPRNAAARSPRAPANATIAHRLGGATFLRPVVHDRDARLAARER